MWSFFSTFKVGELLCLLFCTSLMDHVKFAHVHLHISACSVGASTLRGGWLWSVVPFAICGSCGGSSPNLLDGDTGRAAGEPCEAMKSASCLRAHRLEELPPFFICSWISTSSSSLNDWTQTQRLDSYCNAGEKKNTARGDRSPGSI